MQPLVVIILTLDEEPNLPAALASVGDRAPVLVLDSKSTDRTQDIARQAGAEVHERAFDNYAAQRNHALELVRDRFEWTLFLDADERMTPELWDEIDSVLPRRDIEGVYIGWVFEVLGRDLHHGSFGIASNLRLMRTEAAKFGRATHERVDDSQMRVMRLSHKIRHADAKPLAEWFRKHIRYAQWEAKHYVDGTDAARGLEGLSLRTKAGRMVGVRWVYNKLPLLVRPFLQLGRTVVLHGAWRDGVPGLLYAGMQSFWYPMMIDVFILEEKWRRRQ
jgi:glycosyltransferase involved in cell wall biosynthesis